MAHFPDEADDYLDPRTIRPGMLLKFRACDDPSCLGGYVYVQEPLIKVSVPPSAVFLVLRVHIESREPKEWDEEPSEDYWGWSGGTIVIESLVEGHIGRCAVGLDDGENYGYKLVTR